MDTKPKNNMTERQTSSSEGGEGKRLTTMRKIGLQINCLFASRYLKFDSVPVEVIPGLFLGSVGAALSRKSLKENQISHIVSVIDNMKPFFPEVFLI